MIIAVTARSQICIERTDSCLRKGVYIFYNKKNCFPCYIKIKEYFSEIKTVKSSIQFFGIALLDNNGENEKNVRSHLARTIFNYCDTIIINFASKTIDYYNQQPPANSLFSVYKIQTTPAIIVVSDKLYIYYAKDIFNAKDKINSALKKTIHNIKR